VYDIETILAATGGDLLQRGNDAAVDSILLDSRRAAQGVPLFFALVTQGNDGHRYLADAYRKGVRHFVVSRPLPLQGLEGATLIRVAHTLAALQALAAFHRSRFHFPVIGITGSNGKTIVKEWLFQLLHEHFAIVRNPKSYNSQVGVPLSVWGMSPAHTLGLFEAGISQPGEMEALQRIIRPTIGILTNIGAAHDAGFASRREKLLEKARLFREAETVIGEWELLQELELSQTVFSWGRQEGATLCIRNMEAAGGSTLITAVYRKETISIRVPFTDGASVQNAVHCWCVCLYLGLEAAAIQAGLARLHAVDMRLQLKRGINDCLVVNDSYSADVTSLRIALDFLQQQSAGLRRTVILSDFYETGKEGAQLYREVAALLQHFGVDKVIAIGSELAAGLSGRLPSAVLQGYLSTEAFMSDFRSSSFFNEIILVKGARRFAFERIAQLFERRLHQTVLEINLNALAHNLKEYQKLLKPATKVMAMVKAFSYGSGGPEIASVLQYHNAHYLGVAYADEGVELVKAGITLPIMVMNAEASSFQAIADYNLQPVIYSFPLLEQFESYIGEQGLSAYPVHIEVETGMNRLGFAEGEWEALGRHLAGSPFLAVQSVFSHLAGSEDRALDAFTAAQGALFTKAAALLEAGTGKTFLKHISNSAAIVRHPQWQLDMVRLGIGMYGVEVDSEGLLQLQPVATLRSTIAQLKRVKRGESVSYNRRGVVQRDSIIATVRIGYADGYSRQFGNGRGKMWVKGALAPVMGTVCMDMTMIDVTDIPGVAEGDEVVVFGSPLPVQELAAWIGTIPYELMTGVSQRVKRVYFHE